MKERFTQVCDDFLELAGLPRGPTFVDEGAGCVAVTFELDGVEAALTAEGPDAPRIYSRLTFDDPRAEDDPSFWDDALEANFTLYPAGGPSIACDPWSGKVVIQHEFEQDATPHELLRALSLQCELVRARQAVDASHASRRWSLLQPPGHVAPDTHVDAQASGRLRRLRDHLMPTPGIAQFDISDISDDCAEPSGFILHRDGLQVQLWLAPMRPGFVQLAVDLCPVAETPDAALCELAQLNAWLHLRPNRRVICRVPMSPCYALCSEVELHDDIEDAAAHLSAAIDAATAFRQTLAGIAATSSSAAGRFEREAS